GGGLAQLLQGRGAAPLQSYRAVVIGYALLGALLGLLFTRLSADVEVPRGARDGGGGLSFLGLHHPVFTFYPELRTLNYELSFNP
ncbi:MAG TPA: hypothetical protein VIX18_05130, partial [Nitrospirota bacterium]